MRVHSGLFALAAALFCAASPALAEHRLRTAAIPRAAPPAAAAPMQTFAITSTPFGWADFCSRPGMKVDCDVPLLPAVSAAMTARRWHAADQINRFVNDAIEPISDLENYGVEEYWGYPDNGKGDCEDYVLLKRRMLIQAGFPRQSLLITIVRDEADEGHAVLTLKTDAGDFILDNKTAALKAWSETPYLFVKRQSEENPNVWVALRTRGAPPLSAAVTSTADK